MVILMSEQKRPRVMVDMSATLIHHGHIRLLKKAAEIGDVVVALTTDDEIKEGADIFLDFLTIPDQLSILGEVSNDFS